MNKEKCIACESTKIKKCSFKINDIYPLLECKKCGLKFILFERLITLGNDEYWDEINKKIYNIPSIIDELIKKHEKFLKKIKEKKPPNNRLLDVGCGNCIFLYSASRNGFIPIGIDPSRIAIELCKERYDFTVIHGYLVENSTLPKNFGTITAWDVIEHVDNPKNFLEICNAHLEIGGCLLLETPDESCFIRKIINLFSIIYDLRKYMYYLTHRYYFTRSAIIELLKRTGFDNIDIYSYHSIYSKSYFKIKLYRKYSEKKMLKYKIIFRLLKSIPIFANKQIILAKKVYHCDPKLGVSTQLCKCRMG